MSAIWSVSGTIRHIFRILSPFLLLIFHNELSGVAWPSLVSSVVVPSSDYKLDTHCVSGAARCSPARMLHALTIQSYPDIHISIFVVKIAIYFMYDLVHGALCPFIFRNGYGCRDLDAQITRWFDGFDSECKLLEMTYLITRNASRTKLILFLIRLSHEGSAFLSGVRSSGTFHVPYISIEFSTTLRCLRVCVWVPAVFSCATFFPTIHIRHATHTCMYPVQEWANMHHFNKLNKQ